MPVVFLAEEARWAEHRNAKEHQVLQCCQVTTQVSGQQAECGLNVSTKFIC